MTKAMETIMLAVRGELNMVTDKVTALRRHRAVTLIEAVLYISIALALIVGGLVFFQQASTAAKTSTMVRQLSATIAEARVVINGLPKVTDTVSLNSVLIAAGAVPSDMVTGETSSEGKPILSTPFGGTVIFDAYFHPTFGSYLNIDITNVPKDVCARLLTSTSASGSDYVLGGTVGTTLVSSGYMNGGAGPSTFASALTKGFAMNPTQAGWMCKYGAFNYKTKTSEPTAATPLSGNVTVTMIFFVNA
jgi:preprotein translocase subunit SecG